MLNHYRNDERVALQCAGDSVADCWVLRVPAFHYFSVLPQNSATSASAQGPVHLRGNLHRRGGRIQLPLRGSASSGASPSTAHAEPLSLHFPAMIPAKIPLSAAAPVQGMYRLKLHSFHQLDELQDVDRGLHYKPHSLPRAQRHINC